MDKKTKHWIILAISIFVFALVTLITAKEYYEIDNTNYSEINEDLDYYYKYTVKDILYAKKDYNHMYGLMAGSVTFVILTFVLRKVGE